MPSMHSVGASHALEPMAGPSARDVNAVDTFEGDWPASASSSEDGSSAVTMTRRILYFGIMTWCCSRSCPHPGWYLLLRGVSPLGVRAPCSHGAIRSSYNAFDLRLLAMQGATFSRRSSQALPRLAPTAVPGRPIFVSRTKSMSALGAGFTSIASLLGPATTFSPRTGRPWGWGGMGMIKGVCIPSVDATLASMAVCRRVEREPDGPVCPFPK